MQCPRIVAGVETGRWLHRHGVGILVDEPMAQLPARLAALTRRNYDRMRYAIEQLPEQTLYQTYAERRQIVAAIMGSDGV